MADYLFPDGKPNWELLINPTSKQRAVFAKAPFAQLTVRSTPAMAGLRFQPRKPVYAQAIPTNKPILTKAFDKMVPSQIVDPG